MSVSISVNGMTITCEPQDAAIILASLKVSGAKGKHEKKTFDTAQAYLADKDTMTDIFLPYVDPATGSIAGAFAGFCKALPNADKGGISALVSAYRFGKKSGKFYLSPKGKAVYDELAALSGLLTKQA